MMGGSIRASIPRASTARLSGAPTRSANVSFSPSAAAAEIAGFRPCPALPARNRSLFQRLDRQPGNRRAGAAVHHRGRSTRSGGSHCGAPLPVERLVAYYGPGRKGVQLPFAFQLIFTAWSAQDVSHIVDEYDAAVPDGCWPNWVLGNHDQKRVATRLGAAYAPMAAMLLLTLRGTPTLYYGDELGLENVAIPPDRVQDRWESNEPGLGLGRDPARTPMPWDNSTNAGFTTGTPWLPVNPDYRTRNVSVLAAEPRSILSLYRRLIALRREHAALCVGRFMALPADHDVFAFERSDDSVCLLVLLNFAPEQRQVQLPADADRARGLLSTYMDRESGPAQAELTLRAGRGSHPQAAG
jgi:alpha-glucosidase